MKDKIRWGIISTGRIANSFAQDLPLVRDAEIVAVASRSEKRAKAFAQKHEIPRWYGSYEALAQDPEVDVVYIGTPHIFHKENSMLCLENGKAVLCEKAFTINAQEAQELVDYARQKRLFLMEAMWTRFIPGVVKLRELLTKGIIGDIRMFVGDFGFKSNVDPNSRLYALELGGGALLDLGVYPIAFASMLLGTPKKITGFAHLSETGADDQEIALMEFEGGKFASFYVAIQTSTPCEATIMGSKGYIRVHRPMHKPTKFSISLTDGTEETVEIPYKGKGYHYEATEVVRCLRQKKLESDTMPLNESISIMKIMDELRHQWDVKYPTE